MDMSAEQKQNSDNDADEFNEFFTAPTKTPTPAKKKQKHFV